MTWSSGKWLVVRKAFGAAIFKDQRGPLPLPVVKKEENSLPRRYWLKPIEVGIHGMHGVQIKTDDVSGLFKMSSAVAFLVWTANACTSNYKRLPLLCF